MPVDAQTFGSELEHDPAPPASTRHRKLLVTITSLGAAGILAAGATGVANAASTAATPKASSSATPTAPKDGRPGPMRGSANHADGVITALSSSSITVKDEFGTSKTLAIDSSTKAHRGPKTTVAISSLAVGQRVHVRAATGSTKTAANINVQLAHVGGTVTAVDGSTITVTDRQGFTRTITLADGVTYTKDRAKSTDGAVIKGSVIQAEGKVASDGTTLTASSVDVMTKAPKRGHRGKGHGRKGHGGGFGGPDGRPNGPDGGSGPGDPSPPAVAPSGSSSTS